jgi:hypothetical protein
MHIFIDESGTFVLPSAEHNISLVGALVIPDRRLPYIEKRYSKIRARLPKEKGEVKGRLLGESDIDAVVSMLAEQQVLFEACVIDLGIHTSEDLATHKAGQEIGITKNITDEFSPELKEAVFALRRRLEKLPYQLYVQSVITFELIATVLNYSTMYFSQRIPRELEKFHWVIDGKERDQVTDWEDWWSQVVKPGLQAKSLRDPMPMFVEGDYRYFSRFDGKIPDYLRPHLNNPTEESGTDIGKILSESFRFSSDPELGLELVDILSNATRRALIGNLDKPGWKKIPKLMIHRGQHYVRMLALMKREPTVAGYPYMSVLRDFSKGGRNMLLPHFYND